MPAGKAINQAWKAFELAWAAAGLSDHYFLKQEELHQTLAVLDRSFEEELIEWLYQLCTKPEALKDLAGIIERGQVKPTDNIDAIRAFAYVSVAVSSLPRQSGQPSQVDYRQVHTKSEGDEKNESPDASGAQREVHASIPEDISIDERRRNDSNTVGEGWNTEDVTTASKKPSESYIGDIPLEKLGLSTLSYHRLRRAGIHKLLDLAGKNQEALGEIKNLGQKSINEVKQAIEGLGLFLPFQPNDLLGPSSTIKDEPFQGSQDNNESIDELSTLGLPLRVLNSLHQERIYLISQLLRRTKKDLLAISRLGPSAVNQIRVSLQSKGLSLRDEHIETSAQLEATTPCLRTENEPRQERTENNVSEDDLSTLGLSTRVLNGLYRKKVFFISQLISNNEDEILAFPNLGLTAVEEIKANLQRNGLSLLSKCTQSNMQIDSIRIEQVDESDLEAAWQQLIKLAKEQSGLHHPSFKELSTYCEGCHHGSAKQHLADILERLNASLDLISDTLSQKYPDQEQAIQYSIEALKDSIASQLSQRTAKSATQRVNLIAKCFTTVSEVNWLVYLLRARGTTLAAIGDALNPPVTSERVRQMEARISKVTGIKPTELIEITLERCKAERLKVEKEMIQSWLNQLGRLPIPNDPNQEDSDKNMLWNEISGMDLKSRSALLTKQSLAIPSKEFDYHYQYVVGQYGPVGKGYWREFDNLKQFVLRHAIALGAPELMPKQTRFPRAVGGIVQSYGGQSKVAKRIGLQYQGQLVGSDGNRRYWTDELLKQLLIDINHHHQQEADVMPSYGDVLEFFSATELSEYQEKKPHSAISALTKMGTLHWSEVALRFNKRFISGESQKAVTLGYIKAFVRDLGEHLESLSPAELFVLFQAQGINRGEKEKFSRTFDALVDAVQSGIVDKDELRSWADNNEVESIEDLLNLGSELRAETSIEDKEQKLLERRSQKLCKQFPDLDGETDDTIDDLPALEPLNILRALDKAGDILDNSATDKDKVEFLKAKAAAKLWDSCFQDEGSLIRKLQAVQTEADSYSSEVQQAFLDEYAGARALPIPPTYAFQDLKGLARNPKLMQRLVAYRLERDHRLLNLSGTGTGKTLSAIYAAQICGCQRIFISCPNGVIESWRRSFSSAFPSANLIIKPEGWTLDGIIEGVNVVIVNHERFQDRFAQELLGFCINYQADMIVIDEIHQSKRRTAETSSQRRKLMNEFIRISSNINTDLRVLGLSATPVINNLYEGRSLLELICQEVIDDVGEKIELNACMNLYQHFVVHGIRMNPGQLRRTRLIYQEVDATALLPQIVRATKQGSYHDIEQLLVGPKIASLNNSLVRGEKTVIFLTYIKNTFEPVTRWLAENGYSYSVYTGNEKEAQDAGFRDSLDEFIRGRSEVLVATVQCAGTGIDGLQSVCNRAIFFQLPWTSTEFEQAIGRLDRDGTDFESVLVHIPITEVYLPDGQRWSWCRSKLDRIESKRDIAKAAVDGEIPDAASLISPSDASHYWLKWLEKLNQESQDS